jgi:hypothetical protein
MGGVDWEHEKELQSISITKTSKLAAITSFGEYKPNVESIMNFPKYFIRFRHKDVTATVLGQEND